MNQLQKIIFAFIIILATILRTFGLDHSPPHLSNDEISIAYDAYSILHTQRDEHNHYLPISFQSHNTYKAPLTTYAVVLPTMLLGNNDYSVRLPSAILGILTVLFLGLFILELTKNINLSLMSSFVLAITPWHVHTSRMSLESNLALFFVVSGLYLFYKGINNKKAFLVISSFILFAISLYAYHTEWLFTPLLILVIFLLNKKQFLLNRKYFFGFLIFALIITPIIFDYISNLGTNARGNTEIITKDIKLDTAFKTGQYNSIEKGFLIFDTFLGNYSAYTNLGHLFFNGLGIPSNKTAYQLGLLPVIFLPSFFIGLFFIKKYFKEKSKFIYLWILITPIIPSLTINAPNQVRNLVSVLPYTILMAVGNLVILNYFKKYKLNYLFLIPIIIFLMYAISFYYIHMPLESAEGAQYGYKQIGEYLKDHYREYDSILIDPKFGEDHLYDGVPHLYIPYYTYLDPQRFLDTRYADGNKLFFDKYEIWDFKWSDIELKKGTLYVVPTSNLPKDLMDKLEEVHLINLPNGKKAFALFKLK